MSRHKFTLMAAVCCVAAGTSLSGQDTSPRPTPTFPDRSRGFSGFRSVLSRLSSSSGLSLTNIDKVQEDLSLTEEQKRQLNDLRARTSERQRELDALYQKIHEDFRKLSEDINQQAEESARKLLDEKQAVRIDQLRLQREGITALTRPDVAERLGLSKEQNEALAKLASEYRRRQSPFGGGFGNDPATQPFGGRTNAAEQQQNRERIAADMLAVLTPEQKTKWDEMQGAKFEFPVRGPFGGGFAGGSATSAVEFQVRSRSREFNLGQTASRGGRTLSNYRFVSTFLGPAGPFRYQAIVEALGLSDEQKTQIQALGSEDAKAISELDAEPGADLSAKIAEINQQTQEKIDKVLTDEQKEKLKDLTTP